jgi:transposase
MEAGYCWQPLYDRLEETGYDVKLTHPLKAKAIAQAKVKTDKIDSDPHPPTPDMAIRARVA